MSYIPTTDEQQQKMLEEIGVKSIDELFSDIPESVKLKNRLNIPEAMSELELEAHMRKLAGMNINVDEYTCFLGAGAYDHYIPSVVTNLLSRQEFYTAYTPYQPEISQGTLQAIFEYQTMICSLTGMDVSNASLYDGATALAEAASMACDITRRNEIIITRSVHPESREVLDTYTKFKGMALTECGIKDGTTDLRQLEELLNENTAAVLVQSPNFFGVIENIKEIAEMTHANKSLLVVSCDPISLALLKAPGDLGADIVVGEGQALGNQLAFGGPYLGFIAARREFTRRMPGRIVGETVDRIGRRGYVLTLQTREQHIRREKATSNICSNQALNALAATIYLSVMGKKGLRKVAELCLQKAHYAYRKLIETGLFAPAFNGPFFKEFMLIYSGDVERLNNCLLEKRIIGGFAVERFYPEFKGGYLVAVTEKRTKDDIDRFVSEVVSAC
ncbi:glycine dehydrogenase [decarboxylating] subunit 1 [Thermoclostridium stercorarium subsp. stercorarium DSM 8532]|uniref:Probable glycine dehydrogenase (decarboxylating) subunit 1 n=2 Tax=Thermoclostridium stercorarium TaxID=1510 RepID=L7VMU8_THES1|nr:aminomethyl-transferring glycine dehydrogenase subunit GcvPA [Thermoclostridium stercorarium]AGC67984.1 glycine dehydrogenase [decarboxylating] subunit 1 [Thermoclostridium stercorarium subsp. stercorarium DSM 8532]AGI39019.1 glycine dehydrogenase alpha subunit [Thermoclostridium stercorarium subsp. stercorarium DSM 8532]ANW98386.1 glycine dehydrogenase [Thermoclostridium stercorarium subsp. thermolacticum DSM 2910]UZQ86526.1 aminomethyl-transferring glycine dehydrogenase subunit GcvPA [Ther